MGSYNIVKMQKKLKKYIDGMRYQHTLGVMYTAAALAMCYGVDIEKAQVAGLLHDCAKCIPNDKKMKLCQKYNIPISESENKAPYLLHASLGAYLAKVKYGVEDEDILSAIAHHTTGKPAMTRLEEIIFIADYIEPMRNKASNLAEIRHMAFHDLERAVFVTLRDTLYYLEKDKSCLDNQTVLAYNYYKTLMNPEED